MEEQVINFQLIRGIGGEGGCGFWICTLALNTYLVFTRLFTRCGGVEGRMNILLNLLGKLARKKRPSTRLPPQPPAKLNSKLGTTRRSTFASGGWK